MKILFTSVGRRVELMQAFKQASDELGAHLTIIGADITESAPALYFCDETTLYTKTGDILFPICCTCFTVLTIVLFVIKIKNKKSAK